MNRKERRKLCKKHGLFNAVNRRAMLWRKDQFEQLGKQDVNLKTPGSK